MKGLFAVAVGLMVVGGAALATWDEANVRGLFPYFQSGGDWFTALIFVNASEETSDVVHIRFYDWRSGCSDTISDAYHIRQREQLIVSSAPGVGTWIPTTCGYGYVLFRVVDGGFIHAYCVIYNRMTGCGYIVPAYRQDHGF